MKKKSKITTIIDSFTKNSTLNKDIIAYRRDICNLCPLNSKNIKQKDLKLINKARKRIISSPFCTACGCQIEQKTTQATEECGMVSINQPPKWNRILVDTGNTNDFNLVNLSAKNINIDLNVNDKVFEVDFGVFNSISEKLKVENASIQLVPTSKIKNIVIEIGCGACTDVNYNIDKNNNIALNIYLDFSILGIGNVNKNIYIIYEKNSKIERTQIRLKGKIQ